MDSPDRILLNNLISENRKYLRGLTLNVASGSRSYREFAEKMLTMDLYKQNPCGTKLDVDIQADASKTFPLADEKFDSVICTQFLEHVVNPQHVIEESWRVLKPEGYFILSAPFLERYHADPNDYWRFTKEGIEYLLKDKFEIIKLVPAGGRYIFLLDFLFMHGFPKFLTKALFPFVLMLTKKENNKHKWTKHFFVVAKKAPKPC